MSSAPDTSRFEKPQIREEYAEFQTDEGVVTVVTDPENPLAWVRSTKTLPVEP